MRFVMGFISDTYKPYFLIKIALEATSNCLPRNVEHQCSLSSAVHLQRIIRIIGCAPHLFSHQLYRDSRRAHTSNNIYKL